MEDKPYRETILLAPINGHGTKVIVSLLIDNNHTEYVEELFEEAMRKLRSTRAQTYDVTFGQIDDITTEVERDGLPAAVQKYIPKQW